MMNVLLQGGITNTKGTVMRRRKKVKFITNDCKIFQQSGILGLKLETIPLMWAERLRQQAEGSKIMPIFLFSKEGGHIHQLQVATEKYKFISELSL